MFAQFYQLFRLEKYPMSFSPDSADNKVIILPLKNGVDIDYEFLRTIDKFKVCWRLFLPVYLRLPTMKQSM